MARILIANADRHFTRALSEELHSRDWSVEVALEENRILALLGSKYYDVAILEGGSAGQGMEVLREIRAQGIQVGVVMVSEQGTIEEAVQAIKAGAEEFIAKPVDLPRLSRVLAELLERRCPSTHVLANRLDLFIQTHCTCQGLRIGRLCEQFRISPRYVAKLLERHLRSTFRRRLVYFRLQKAKQLIESTDLPLYTIAERCGFGSPSRLSTAFHRHEGLPPRRYRTLREG
jgi:YesN/AraC family two-component response regulator